MSLRDMHDRAVQVARALFNGSHTIEVSGNGRLYLHVPVEGFIRTYELNLKGEACCLLPACREEGKKQV